MARIAELFQERTEELAQTISREMGKPIAESRDEAEFCAEIFRYHAENGPRLTADQILEDTEGASNVIRQYAQRPALANNTQYGLGSAVFATEPGHAERFAEQLDAGMVGAN